MMNDEELLTIVVVFVVVCASLQVNMKTNSSDTNRGVERLYLNNNSLSEFQPTRSS